MSNDKGKGADVVGVEKSSAFQEKANWNARWIIEKFKNEEFEKNGTPYEVSVVPGNILLNEGIAIMWALVCGIGTEQAYNNATARIGVGDSSTAADATQLGLQAAVNKAYEGMETSFPAITDETVAFKSVFATGVANFDWEEFSIDNGSVADENMNRKVISKGTKTSSDTWTVTLEVTLS